MLCKCHWIMLYTVHFTAFSLGGRFFRTRCILTATNAEVDEKANRTAYIYMRMSKLITHGLNLVETSGWVKSFLLLVGRSGRVRCLKFMDYYGLLDYY